jgi:hypothetical protein
VALYNFGRGGYRSSNLSVNQKKVGNRNVALKTPLRLARRGFCESINNLLTKKPSISGVVFCW